MNEKEAVEILRKYANDKDTFKKVYAHSKAVQKAALRIGKKAKADLEFIRIAALLHDIGRFSYKPGTKSSIRHGVEGAKILRKEGLQKYSAVAETHLGIGIRKTDIKKQKLPLVKKDYIPKTKEEKIIAYADNLVFDNIEKTEKDVVNRYRKELGEAYAKRMIKFNKEIKEMIKNV